MAGYDDFSREKLLEEVEFLRRQLEERDEHMSANVDNKVTSYIPIHCRDIPSMGSVNGEIVEFQKWMFENYPNAAQEHSNDEVALEGEIRNYISLWRQSTFTTPVKSD